MRGDIIEKSIFESTGFLSPMGRFYSIEELSDEYEIREHEDLAEHLRGYTYKGSAKDYLINHGWVAVSVIGQIKKLTYNSLALRDNIDFEEKFNEYIRRGFEEDDLAQKTPSLRKATIIMSIKAYF